jgi:hypothetical protein
MSSAMHSDVSSLKSGLLHITGQLRVEQHKSKMELEAKFLGTISLIDTEYSLLANVKTG